MGKQSNSSQNSSDLLSDILGKDSTVSSAPSSDDFFNPRAVASSSGETAEFGDFTSAFGGEPTAVDTPKEK